MDYDKKSDNKLLEMYKSGDERAFDEIVGRYKSVVRMYARDFFLAGGDGEDLIQEGTIGLFDAVKSYRDDKNTGFATFASLCIRRRILKAVDADNRLKHIPLNNSISLDSIKKNNNILEQESETFGDRYIEEYEDPAVSIVKREEIQLFLNSLVQLLSKMEADVFKLFREGKEYKEIALIIGKPPKSVDNALQRILSKAERLRLTNTDK